MAAVASTQNVPFTTPTASACATNPAVAAVNEGSVVTKKATSVPSLEEYYRKLLDCKITFSKPKAKKDGTGFTIYAQDSTQAGGPVPQFLFPRTKCPFKPSYGTLKTNINQFTPMSMELSIEDTEFGRFVLQVFQEHDNRVRACVATHSVELFKRQLPDAELAFIHRPSLTKSAKTGAFPYLLRLKAHPTDTKTTKCFTVTGTNDRGQNVCKVSTLDDMDAFCEVLNLVEFSNTWTASRMFGSTFMTRKSMQWPPVKRGRNDDASDDMTADDMGDFAVDTTAPAAATASTNNDTTGDAGAGSNTTVDTAPGKRMRKSVEDDGAYAPQDMPYENSEEEEEEDGDEE